METGTWPGNCPSFTERGMHFIISTSTGIQLLHFNYTSASSLQLHFNIFTSLTVHQSVSQRSRALGIGMEYQPLYFKMTASRKLVYTSILKLFRKYCQRKVDFGILMADCPSRVLPFFSTHFNLYSLLGTSFSNSHPNW